MAKIIWNEAITSANKAEIEKHLEPFLWLVPKWCQHLFIGLWDADGDAAISTIVDYQYRRIELNFYSSWLTQSEYLKRDNVIHECVHFNVNHLFIEARSIVTNCLENEQLKNYAFEQLKTAVESITQDLTFAINSQFDKQM